MKKNYDLGLRKKKGKSFCTSDDHEHNESGCCFLKTCNSTGNKFKSNQGLNALYDTNGRKYKTINDGSIGVN